jgi:hypothetical protein
VFSIVCKRGAHREIAFNIIYRYYFPFVFNWCKKKLGNWHSAEDAAQETLMRVASKTVFEKKAPFSSFIFAVANNVVREYWARLPQLRLERIMRKDLRFERADGGVWALSEGGKAEVDAIRNAFVGRRRVTVAPRRSLANAAIVVLADANKPMSAKAIVDMVIKSGLIPQPSDGKGPRVGLTQADVNRNETVVPKAEITDIFYYRACEELHESFTIHKKRPSDYLAFHLAVLRRRYATVDPKHRVNILKDTRVFPGSHVFGRYLWLRTWSEAEGNSVVGS